MDYSYSWRDDPGRLQYTIKMYKIKCPPRWRGRQIWNSVARTQPLRFVNVVVVVVVVFILAVPAALVAAMQHMAFMTSKGLAAAFCVCYIVMVQVEKTAKQPNATNTTHVS